MSGKHQSSQRKRAVKRHRRALKSKEKRKAAARSNQHTGGECDPGSLAAGPTPLGVKASELLMDFADPLIAAYRGRITLDEVTSLFEIAAEVWNATMDERGQVTPSESRSSILRQTPLLARILDIPIDRALRHLEDLALRRLESFGRFHIWLQPVRVTDLGGGEFYLEAAGARLE